MTMQPTTAPNHLGGSDVPIGRLAWGMWRLSDGGGVDARALVEAALEAGITLFDTADIYGVDKPAGFGSAEALLGRTLAEDPALRARIVLATKGGIRPGTPYDSSPAYLMQALDASLERLRTDYVDLYQIHRRDLMTHPHELAAVLDRMTASGKVRALGVSNYSPAEVEALAAFLECPLASTQPQFSALHTQPLFDGTIDQAMTQRLTILAWSPLAGGRLADYEQPATRALAAHGRRFGVDAATAALSWVMAHPAGIIPIIGSQSPDRIRAAAAAASVEWTRSEWYEVLQVGLGESLP